MPAMDYSRIADRYDLYAQTDIDVPFFLQEARGCHSVLELTSGTGRLSLPLIQAHIPLTCLDNSPEMLAVLRRKLFSQGLAAPVYQMDASSFSLPQQFDLIIIPFNAFAEFADPVAQQTTLAAIRSHLTGNGRLICTLHNPQVRLKIIDGQVHYSAFWSLYGRYAWDDQREPSRVSDPPERIVDVIRTRCRSPNERVLDAGCGTGNYVIALAQAGFCVIGTDFAVGMLAKARDKVTNDLSRFVSFQQADLNMPLEFPTARFDHIISISVLQAVANPLFTLSELQRVLKPGGTLVLSLPKQNSALFSQSVGELVRYRIHHLERRTPGKILLVILKSFADRFSYNPRWTRLQAQEMMRAGGFKVISLDEGRQILVVAEQVAT